MSERDIAGVRASFSLGTMYAVDGQDGWIYFGQVANGGDMAFYRFRSLTAEDVTGAMAYPIMSRFSVQKRSVGAALRQGVWTKLSRLPLPPVLNCPSPRVQWPVGTATVTVWMRMDKDGGPTYQAAINDPAVQEFEIASSWDAVLHVPERLRLDFGDAESGAWHVGGPVWRQRRSVAEMAKRHPSAANRWIAAAAMLTADH